MQVLTCAARHQCPWPTLPTSPTSRPREAVRSSRSRVPECGDDSTVDQQIGSGDERGVGTDEEVDCCGDVVWGPDPAGTARGDHRSHDLAVRTVELCFAHRGGDDAGRNGIDPGTPSTPRE